MDFLQDECLIEVLRFVAGKVRTYLEWFIDASDGLHCIPVLM